MWFWIVWIFNINARNCHSLCNWFLYFKEGGLSLFFFSLIKKLLKNCNHVYASFWKWIDISKVDILARNSPNSNKFKFLGPLDFFSTFFLFFSFSENFQPFYFQGEGTKECLSFITAFYVYQIFSCSTLYTSWLPAIVRMH